MTAESLGHLGNEELIALVLAQSEQIRLLSPRHRPRARHGLTGHGMSSYGFG